jgi:uncharacterized protein (TIGR03435 family)
MIRSIAGVCLVAVASYAVFGQEKAPPPTFEVVSVKPTPSVSRDSIGLHTYPGGRIRATKLTLKLLILYAYDMEMYRILGGPHWTDEDRFDVEAKPPASSESSKWVPASFKTPPNLEMRQMLQTLLADRFQLKVHTETKKEQVYALVAAKGGPKLKQPKSTADQPFVSFLPHGLSGQNATLDQLVERLVTVLSRPVLNHTGIEGHFDFLIDYPPDDAGTDRTVLLLSAIQDQIGLRLETQPGSVEVLVIDHAEKPSAN